MKIFSALMLTVGILRLLGGFPYTWSCSPPTFSRRKVLVAWTTTAGLLYTSSVVLVGLINELNTKKIPNLTVKVCIDILNTNSYLVSTSLLGHAIYKHHLLLELLKTLFQVPGIQLEERLTRMEKVVSAVMLVIVFAHFASFFFLFFFVIEGNSFSKSVILYLSRVPFDGITFIVPVFFHLVVRMLTSALEDRFLSSSFYASLSVEDSKEGQSKTTSDRSEQASEPFFLSSQGKSRRPLSAKSLRSFTCDILKQYNALEKIISYIQLPSLVLLLNEIVYLTVMTYFMVAETNEHSNMAVPLSFLCCSLFRAMLLVNFPDHMADKRQQIVRYFNRLKMVAATSEVKEEIDHVISALQDGPSFSIFGLFVLGRHCFLSIVSFVTTYVIIAYQLEVGERTNQLNNVTFLSVQPCNSSL